MCASAGDERPVDIRLANGEVLRSRCKVLADGGRMVTYGNVSDLVRSAEEMAELAMKDALTGIYNRRHFMGRLDGEWQRFRRYGRPLSLLLLGQTLLLSLLLNLVLPLLLLNALLLLDLLGLTLNPLLLLL